MDRTLARSAPLYRAGNILVSIKTINAVAILDGQTLAVLWLWGPTNLTFQHAPTLLRNGNVLVFNNGTGRRSSVLEIDPRTDRVVWRYAPSTGFFSNIRGACQRLSNGNTSSPSRRPSTPSRLRRPGKRRGGSPTPRWIATGSARRSTA